MVLESQVIYYSLAAFLLDFFAFGLILAFGINLLLEGQKKENEISKQFTMGIGLFFSSISISSLIYGVDLFRRTFVDGKRIFPARAEYLASGFDFDSVHIESYFLLVLVFLLLALYALTKPIEKYMLNREKPIISKIDLIISPLPLITRGLELLILPQAGTWQFYLLSALYGFIWIMIVVSVILLLAIYIKTGFKATGDVKKRAIAIVVSIIIWFMTIFLRPTFFKSIDDIGNGNYSKAPFFWTMPVILLIMFGLFIYGFSQNLGYGQSEEKRFLYENWFFKAVIVGVFITVSAYIVIVFWNGDLYLGNAWYTFAENNPFWKAYGDFWDRSAFEGDGFGGQDLSYIFIGIALILYIISNLPAQKEKMKTIRMYTGYALVAAIGLMVMNRGIKGLIGRARPSHTYPDNASGEYSSMWMFGALDIGDAFSGGSFTSGHTTTAMLVVIFAFILIRTHKTWIISLGFTATITWTLMMGLGRVMHGAHYPSDTLWAIITGLILITIVYFKLLKIPKQEEGIFSPYVQGFVELRYGIWLALFLVFVILGFVGLKYTILDFEWYWPILIIIGPLSAWIIRKRMHFLMYGPIAKQN